MTSQSQSAGRTRRIASTKIIFTRRSQFAEMDHSENGLVNDDDDIEESGDCVTKIDIGVDEVKHIPDHITKLGSSSNNGTHLQLLQKGAAVNDTESFDSFENRVSAENGQEGKIEKPKVANNNEDTDNDFTDMALKKSSKDVVDLLDFGHGDHHQQKQRIKYAQENDKYNRVRRKNKSKFPPSVKFGWFDMCIGVLSIGLFFVDIGTDIELAVHYFRNSKWMYGGVTTGLIVIPSLVTCFLGLHWYIIDYNREKEILQKHATSGNKARVYKTPSYVWYMRFFFTLLQCGPAVRLIEYLHCGYKSRCKHIDPRDRKIYYKFMLYEDVDSCLLRLFESFLEAAPQLTWQLYIVIDLKPKEDVAGTSLRALAMLSSWGSLAIALTSYHKSLRNCHEEKAKMTLKSLPVYFIWRACETGGRMLCIAMFASAFRLWVFGPLVFHWAFMSGWLIMQRTTFYKNNCMEKVFNIICGYVMIFCFLNLREGQTRFRVLLFYFILYVENFIMLALWFRFTQDLGAWFHLWGFIVVLLLFVFHVTFQLLYYTFLHPTKNIKICLPCTRNVVCSSICYEVQPIPVDTNGKDEILTILEICMEDKVQHEVENS